MLIIEWVLLRLRILANTSWSNPSIFCSHGLLNLSRIPGMLDISTLLPYFHSSIVGKTCVDTVEPQDLLGLDRNTNKLWGKEIRLKDLILIKESTFSSVGLINWLDLGENLVGLVGLYVDCWTTEGAKTEIWI